MMKKYFILTIITITIIFALAACASTPILSDEQPEILAYETTDLPTSGNITVVELPDNSTDSYSYEGIGGYCFGLYFHVCTIHVYPFHSFDIFIAENIITIEEFHAWASPLRSMRTSPYDECLVNLSTFIEYFGIAREAFQQLIDDTRIDFFMELNLDVLFSGDQALIDEFYCITNAELHAQLANERERVYWAGRIQELQYRVNANTATMSRYFHDMWTYASFMNYGGKWFIYHWMQDLVEAGEYDRVNIVEFVQFAGLEREHLQHWVTLYDMNIFTHYNLDIIFSGDPRLIASYYSIENEALHTAQVQMAFTEHVALYGVVDRLQIGIN